MAMSFSDAVERFAKLPAQQRVGAMLLVCAFFGVIFYFMLYSDLTEQTGKLDREIQQLEGEKATYEDRKQKYRAFRAEVNRLLEEQKELLKVLPDEANISTFLQSIHAQAELSGVQILTYDQQPEAVQNFYAQIPVRMAISGSYHQIAKFFYAMERDLKRIIKVENVALTLPTGTGDNVVLKANFSASTYRFVGKRPG